MKTSLHPMPVLSISAAGALLLLAGCSTPATYVETGGPEVVVNVGQINIQDFNQAADSMVKSLIDNFINTGKCKSSVAGEPALMAISKIINDTGIQEINPDLLVKKIRTALNQTGRIQTTTTMGLGGAEDVLAKEITDAGGFLNDKPLRLPDYTLSGKIIQLRAKSGSIRQSTFSFQLSLTSRSGVAVWEDVKEITKQGRRPSVGF